MPNDRDRVYLYVFLLPISLQSIYVLTFIKNIIQIKSFVMTPVKVWITSSIIRVILNLIFWPKFLDWPPLKYPRYGLGPWTVPCCGCGRILLWCTRRNNSKPGFGSALFFCHSEQVKSCTNIFISSNQLKRENQNFATVCDFFLVSVYSNLLYNRKICFSLFRVTKYADACTEWQNML